MNQSDKNTDTIRFINELISKSTGELRQLFQRYGIDEPVSPQSLTAAAAKHGQPFKLELYSIAQKIKSRTPNSFTMVSSAGIDEFSSETLDLMGGEQTAAPQKVQQEDPKANKLNWESFNSLLGNAVGLFGEINAAAGNKGPNSITTPQNVPVNNTNESPSLLKNPVVLVVIAVVVIGLVVAVVRKMRA